MPLWSLLPTPQLLTCFTLEERSRSISLDLALASYRRTTRPRRPPRRPCFAATRRPLPDDPAAVVAVAAVLQLLQLLRRDRRRDRPLDPPKMRLQPPLLPLTL